MENSSMPKITIEEFVECLQKQKLNGQFISGIIIRKDKDSISIEEIRNKIPDSVLIEINQNSENEQVLSLIKGSFEEKKWIVFNLSDGYIAPVWREQFNRLRDSNSVFIQGKGVEDTFFSKQPAEMRIVAVIDEENIGKVDYPQFLNLFGLILDL